jgi:tRNA1Val (adenine37-N6)-methyltransferase
MKVCTDACLFGAWVASLIEQDESIQEILDIGTGTGLLSLMLAQKTGASIDAVEINEAAALQAKENFNNAPWKERLKLIPQAIENFEPGKRYDLIISNPPFFEDDLKSMDAAKNAAKHDTTLTLDELLIHIQRLLNENGKAAVLIPWHRTDQVEKSIKKNGFSIPYKMLVKQSVNHGYFRSMLFFTNHSSEVFTKEIFIHDTERRYSDAFTELLRKYYLNL